MPATKPMPEAPKQFRLEYQIDRAADGYVHGDYLDERNDIQANAIDLHLTPTVSEVRDAPASLLRTATATADEATVRLFLQVPVMVSQEGMQVESGDSSPQDTEYRHDLPPGLISALCGPMLQGLA